MSNEKLKRLISIACDGDRSIEERKIASDALTTAGFNFETAHIFAARIEC
ncbi:MAG TPA: hypothetical protein PKY81_10500 [bacterium]|nr:hypothetical protein [bacterium]HPN31377.1 hypothetical protein [bacterium]